MAKIYYRNVRDNNYPLEQVPEKWRNDVAEMLETGNHDKDRDNEA